MAKKKKQRGSETRKFNAMVRMEEDLAEKARMVAALKKISLAEYLSVSWRPVVDRDYHRLITKLADEEKTKGEPKS